MKIVRVRIDGGRVVYGALQDSGAILELEGNIFGDFKVSGVAVSGDLLAPIEPTSIFCTGLNYRAHAEETGAELPKYPILFMKGLNAITGPGAPIYLPRHLESTKVDYECELAIVIGKKAKNVTRDRALDYVLGYTCANDVSARDWQKHGGGGQWCRGKTFDTFCPLGPALVTCDEIDDPNALAISTTLNGKKLQDSSTADMIFDVPAIIEFFSGSTTLLPGTLILTGTPSGVGMGRDPSIWLQPGDEVTIEIEKVGKLTNPVLAEPTE